MAEVRAIPSAVGAFEAQVLNTSSAYAYLMKQAAEDRKSSAAQKKQVEETLYTALNDKRVIRANDSDYIEGLRLDLQNYYFQNENEIARRGKAYNELQKKMGLFTSEVTRSMSAKDQEKEVLAYTKAIYDNPEKNTAVSVPFKEGIAVLNLPINDQRRKDYTFKNELGQDVGIEQLSINELDRVAFFTPTRLDNAVLALPRDTYRTESIQKGKGTAPAGTDVTRAYSYISPMSIWNTVRSMPATYPDMLNKYKEMSTAEAKLYEGTSESLEQRMNNTLKKMDEFYTRAGASQKGTGFGSISSLFEIDGVPGINLDNPLEYALFQQLYANLPRDLGMSYDYKTQTNYRSQQSLNLNKQSLYLQQKQYEEAGSLDGIFIKNIKEGKFNAQEASAFVNSFLVSEDALGGIKPGSVVFDDKNKTMTITTTKPLYNTDGSLIYLRPQAQAFEKTPGSLGTAPGGFFTITETKTFSIDKNTAGWETNISNGLSLAQSAIINDKVEQTFGSLRTKAGANVIKELQR